MKELNLDGYLANVFTWRNYLTEEFLRDSSSVVFHCGFNLLKKLSKEPYGAPNSIDVVIDELVLEGHLVTFEDFYNGSMYPKEPPRLLKWMGLNSRAHRKFESRSNETQTSYLKEIDLLIRPIIEKKFESIYKNIEERIISPATGITDLIFSVEEFYETAGFNKYLKNDGTSYEIMMTYLSRYRNVLHQKGDIVKIIAEPVSSMLKDSPRLFSENDMRIAALKKSISNVNNQVNKVEAELSQYSTMLKHSIHNGSSRETQKEYLLGKKLSQKYLTTLLNYRNSLNRIRCDINMASTNELIIGSLDASNKLLRSINESAGSVDKLHNLLDEIKEQKDKTEEMNNLLASDEDYQGNDEIEKELQEMIKDRESTTETSSENKEDLLDKLRHLEIAETDEEYGPSKVISSDKNTDTFLLPKLNSAEKQPIAEL